MREVHLHTLSEEDIAHARAGDRPAFGRVMDAYLPLAYRIAFKLLGSGDDAQDVCQAAFIRVWEHFPSYEPSRPFAAWLTSIVTRLAIDRLRRRRRLSEWFVKEDVGSDHVGSMASRGPGTAQKVEWADLGAVVVLLAGRLPPTQRVVFALRDLEDLDVDEVSTITGLSSSSVKANLSYARRRIREILIREYRVEEVAS